MRNSIVVMLLVVVMLPTAVQAEEDEHKKAEPAPSNYWYSPELEATVEAPPIYLMYYDLPEGGTLCHFWQVNRRGFARFPDGCSCEEKGFLRAFSDISGIPCDLDLFKSFRPQTLRVPAPEYIGQRQERAEWLGAVAERDRLRDLLEHELGKFPGLPTSPEAGSEELATEQSTDARWWGFGALLVALWLFVLVKSWRFRLTSD